MSPRSSPSDDQRARHARGRQGRRPIVGRLMFVKKIIDFTTDGIKMPAKNIRWARVKSNISTRRRRRRRKRVNFVSPSEYEASGVGVGGGRAIFVFCLQMFREHRETRTRTTSYPRRIYNRYLCVLWKQKSYRFRVRFRPVSIANPVF